MPPSPATVPCKDPPVECQPGQSCCFHDFDPAADMCAASGTCDSSEYIEFACNQAADCPGATCCATVINGTVINVACERLCNGSQKRVMCVTGAECFDGTCDPFPTVGIDYPGYGWCK